MAMGLRNIDSHIRVSRKIFHGVVVVPVKEAVINFLSWKRELENNIVSL
jgi:hypothetical protein